MLNHRAPSAHTIERSGWAQNLVDCVLLSRVCPAAHRYFHWDVTSYGFTALNHTDGQYYSRKVGDNSLPGFMPVEIKCADLHGLLVGRPPEVKYDAVRIDAQTKADSDLIVLLLQRRFRGTVGRISVMRDTGELSMAEVLDVHGNRLYTARIADMQTVDGFRLPANITLTGSSGNLTLDVKRIWPGASVTQDLFRIAPPQSD